MRLTLIAFAAALALTPTIASALAAAPAATAAHYSTDTTTIGELLADPAAKAAVEKHIPGMLSNDQIEMAKDMTLKQIQQYSPDTVTDKALGDIDAEFAKMPVKK